MSMREKIDELEAMNMNGACARRDLEARAADLEARHAAVTGDLAKEKVASDELREALKQISDAADKAGAEARAKDAALEAQLRGSREEVNRLREQLEAEVLREKAAASAAEDEIASLRNARQKDREESESRLRATVEDDAAVAILREEVDVAKGEARRLADEASAAEDRSNLARRGQSRPRQR